LNAVELARRVGRGKRSALGIHGFEQGGFLVEAGKTQSEDIAPLVARVPFPEDWGVLLVIPPSQESMHGSREAEAIARLQGDERVSARLHKLALEELLPAVRGANLEAFGEALYEFNRLVGEQFAPVQGGPYAPASEPIVRCLREAGLRGVAQSSWGPTVAAIGEPERLHAILGLLRDRLRTTSRLAFVVQPANAGAQIQ
jgi:beta-RFAP synthase